MPVGCRSSWPGVMAERELFVVLLERVGRLDVSLG